MAILFVSFIYFLIEFAVYYINCIFNFFLVVTLLGSRNWW